MPKSGKIVSLFLAIITATFLLYSLTGNSGLHFSKKNQEPDGVLPGIAGVTFVAPYPLLLSLWRTKAVNLFSGSHLLT
jgi:hypothetical protein